MKKLSLVNLNNEVNNFINVKSEGEIKKIRELAGFTIGCFKSMKLFINSGKTQKEIASFLKQSFLRKGDGLAFPICVTSGLELKETTASFPSDEKILNKDAVTAFMAIQQSYKNVEFTFKVVGGETIINAK